MSIQRFAFGAVVISAGVLAACVQQQPADANVVAEVSETAAAPSKEVKLGPAISTVKPGASVTFSHDLSGKVAAGENGAVTVTVNEGYPSGTLHLKATGDPGLSVFGAEVTAQKDMSLGTTHTWRLDYAAENDGLYYINVLAQVEMADGLQESRAYAIRVEVGDWQAAQAKVQAANPVEMQADGEPAVILEAEETIN